MKKKLLISIPNPCHEKWSSFTPTVQGGFCSGCQKEVIDFTNWSEERIKAYFNNRPTNTCGRFKKEQLTVYTYEKSSPSPLIWMSSILMGILILFTSRQVMAQRSSKPKYATEQYQSEQKNANVSLKHPGKTISGIVKDEVGQPLPGANILRKGTSQGTTSDANGRFIITLENPDSIETMVFTFIGYRTIERIVATNEPMQELTIDMTIDAATLQGDIIVGGASDASGILQDYCGGRLKVCFSNHQRNKITSSQFPNCASVIRKDRRPFAPTCLRWFAWRCAIRAIPTRL